MTSARKSSVVLCLAGRLLHETERRRDEVREADEVQTRVAWHYIAPGKPTQNAFVEASTGASGTNVSLNLRCSLQCLQALLPGMKQAGFGRVVNIASRAALGKERRSVYAATKAGLIGMAKVWALELGGHGITANSIGPGPIRTELFDRANPPGSPATQAILDPIPVGRMGEPEDIANAVAFLLDARSSFVTGQTLFVCGGMTVGAAGN